MYRQHQIHILVPPGEHWVVLYKPWFEVLAPLLENRPITAVQCLEEIREKRAGSVTLMIIGPSSLTNPFQALALRQRLDMPLGLLPATTVEEAQQSIIHAACQNTPLPNEDILIDRTTQGDARLSTQRRIFPEGSIVHDSQMFSLLTHPVRLLAITGHGRNDVVHLPHALLCGRNGTSEQFGENDKLAVCAFSGKCFHKEQRRISPLDLQASILFLNSCSAITGSSGIFSPDFSLDAAILKNKRISHFIGSPVIHHGESAQAELLSILLDHGVSIGQAVEIIDNASLLQSIDTQSLLIYGDPSAQFPSSASDPIFIAERSSETCELVANCSLLFVPILPIPEEILTVEAPVPLRVIPIHNGYFLFNSQGLPPGLYRWKRVCLDDIVRKIDEQLLSPVRDFKQVKNMGIHPHKLPGRITDLENRFARVRKSFFALTSEKSLSSLDRTLAQVGRVVHDADLVTMEALVEVTSRSAFHMSEVYRAECRMKTSSLVLEPCKTCGSPVREVVWESPLEPHFARRTRQCYRCGYISDIPANQQIQAELRLSPEIVMIGESTRVEVRFSEPPPPQSLLSCVLSDTQRFGSPPIVQRGITEGNSCLYRFHLHLSHQLPAHQFWLCFYMVWQGKVFFWETNLWLKPRN